MKKLIAISLFLTAGFLPISAQNEKSIKADIKHVTVFPDRAQIEQESAVTTHAGQKHPETFGICHLILMYRAYR